MTQPNEIQELRDRDDIDDIKRYLLDEYENVKTVVVGYRYVDDERTDEAGLIASVVSKEVEDDLDDDEVIPREIRGIPIDVYELGTEPSEQRSDVRISTLRPVPSGCRHARPRNGESSGMVGTLGPALTDNTNGNRIIATACHTMVEDEDDGGVPDDSINDVIGKPVYQTTYDADEPDNRRIGEVVAAEYDRFDGSTHDWCTIALDYNDYHTNEVLGCGRMGEYREPSFDQPLVISGASSNANGMRKTELVGLDAISGNGLEDMIQYKNVTENGDSGAAVGQFDEDGIFHPCAVHVADGSYGQDLNVILNEVGDYDVLSDPSDHAVPNPDPSDGDYFEAAVVQEDHKESTVTASVWNGGSDYGYTAVETLEGDGTVVDTETVAIEPMERREVTLDVPKSGEYQLQTRDIKHPHRPNETVERTVQDLAEHGRGVYIILDDQPIKVS